MKLEAKVRLRASSSAEREQAAARITPVLRSTKLKFTPVQRLNPSDLYPHLGLLYTPACSSMNMLSVSLNAVDKTTATIAINLVVDWSNDIYNGSDPKKALTAIKEAAAAFKAVGKVKVVKPAPTIKVQVPSLRVTLPMGTATFGIRVRGVDGKPHVFTSTQHSRGPWTSREEAESHIRDLQSQLAYDDDFKRVTDFQVVAV